MIRRALLTLLLSAPLAGCFFSLDGSLVDKKRDAGQHEVSADRSSPDRGHGEAQADGSSPSDAVAPAQEQLPGG